MSTFAEIVGWLLILCLAAGFAAALVYAAIARYQLASERWRYQTEELAMRRLGGRIHTASWWMSEDKSAMLALQALSESLEECGNFDADAVRNKWRAARAAADKTAPGPAPIPRSNGDAEVG